MQTKAWSERLKEMSGKRWPRVIAAFALVLFVAALLGAGHLLSEYSRHAALVDARLADRSLHRPAGIYAAPRRVSLRARLTREELIERLLRAGYQQGEGATEFAAGNFVVRDNDVVIRTQNFARGENTPPVAAVSFAKNEVVGIADAETSERMSALALPAEMLTAELDAKNQTRRATRYEELPPRLVAALLAIEDRRFFSHPGVDIRGVVRALYRNLMNGRVVEGGSTITQQFVKNQLLTPERTMGRKLSEALMAVALERRLSKEQILTLYCDRIYLGHSGGVSIYGFKQAARVYFGKELNELTLAESAFLAGLIQAPNRYAPHTRLESALARRDTVLAAMVETGAVGAAEAEEAKREQIALRPPQRLDDSSAAYFVDYLRRELGRTHLEEETWPQLQIDTTLDLDLQQAANKVVNAHLDRLGKIAGKRAGAMKPEAALVALDPRTGEILAMVGGRDYATSQLNRAIDARRQPGSVFKPVVYAAAMSHGISPASTFSDAPREITFGYKAVYRPQNFGHSYSNRQVTLREAMVRSLNVVTVDAAMQTGLGAVAEMAARMGLPRPDTYPSMALGAFEATPLEVAAAYTTFANSGIRATPFAIRGVRAQGQMLLTGGAAKAGVMSAGAAYLVTDALADVVNRGTASRVRALGYKGPAAGKTGTSRDAWFVGYTPKLLVAVWVGYDDNRDLGLTGGEAAVPLWTDFVKRALEVRPDLQASQFARPAGLQEVEVCAENGLAAGEYCPARQKMLLAGYLLPGSCFNHYAPPESYEIAELPPAADEPYVDYGQAAPLPAGFELRLAPAFDQLGDAPQDRP
jgi:penicillin-binding protein 1B